MKHLLSNTPKLSVLLLISFFLLASSCNRETEEHENLTLPPITTTGENTFGCLIDGNVLIPRDGTASYLGGTPKGMIIAASGDHPNYLYEELRIKDYKTGNGGILKLHFDGIHNYGEGGFAINESNCQDGIYANQNINITCRWGDNWYCSIENGGSATILKYDVDNYIISGTFSCTVQNRDDSTDIIEITEGRFDIHTLSLLDTIFP